MDVVFTGLFNDESTDEAGAGIHSAIKNRYDRTMGGGQPPLVLFSQQLKDLECMN